MKKRSIITAAFVFIMTIAVSSTVMAGVTGKVNFTGTAPERAELNMNADPSCASANSGPVLDQAVVVNANNTLKNVFVYVKQGLEGQNFKAPKEAVVLDQVGCKYEPHVLGAMVNQPIEIRNSDATLHNVHSLPKKSKEFNLGMPIKGMKLKKKFPKEEVMVKMKCDVHPWMSAYVGVLPHPFFAVSGDDGSFEIKDLADGAYVLEAWHETYGTQTANVTVAGGAATVDFSFAG